jgi:hypothetical protein
MLVAFAVAASVAAASAASLVERASAAARAAPEKTTLRVVALTSPARLRLDRSAPVSVTVANRGRKTVRRVAVKLSLGPIPDPGFKITWATARSGALKPGASRTFAFRIKISSRFDKDHTKKVSGQTISFYGAGTYMLEACTGLAPRSDEGCRESHTITAH